MEAVIIQILSAINCRFWTNLTVSLDGQQTANTLFVKMLDHIYVVSPLSPSPSPTKSTLKGAQR
jgi:hypothetical protein